MIPEIVKFWKWVNDKLIGIVTSSTVYHVSIENVSGTNLKISPQKIC